MGLIDIENIDYVRLEDSLHCLEHHKGDEVECVICAPIVEAIPKADYENRLKADLKAVLVELQLEIKEMDSGCGWEGYRPTAQVLEVIQQKINELPPATPQEQRWIPLTKRPMTDEEQEYYKEWADIEGAMIFDCPLPEDGQEVLVSYGDYVCVDTFCKYDGCYFEGVDIDDVDAWMPLPKPCEPQESEET